MFRIPGRLRPLPTRPLLYHAERGDCLQGYCNSFIIIQVQDEVRIGKGKVNELGYKPANEEDACGFPIFLMAKVSVIFVWALM